jgi:hypothetical protein
MHSCSLFSDRQADAGLFGGGGSESLILVGYILPEGSLY